MSHLQVGVYFEIPVIVSKTKVLVSEQNICSVHLKNSVFLFQGWHVTGGVSPRDPEQPALLIEPMQPWVFPTVNLEEQRLFSLQMSEMIFLFYFFLYLT